MVRRVVFWRGSFGMASSVQVSLGKARLSAAVKVGYGKLWQSELWCIKAVEVRLGQVMYVVASCGGLRQLRSGKVMSV
jgi:hypothetical protein